MRSPLSLGFWALVAGTLLGSVSGPVQATPIVVFNTGVTCAGNGHDAANGSTDAHYHIVTVGCAPACQPAFVIDQNFSGNTLGYKFSCADGSKWISVTACDLSCQPRMDTDFETTFSLTGLCPQTVSLAGCFGADCCLEGACVNGTFIPVACMRCAVHHPEDQLITGFHLDVCNAAGDFLPNLNQITFVVDNEGGGPLGLDIENFHGAAIPTPELDPRGAGGAVALLGLTVLGLERRRYSA